MAAMIDLKVTTGTKYSLLTRFDGNLYTLCNYDGTGLLVDILTNYGEKRLIREIKLLVPFMYCNGNGMSVKEAILTNDTEDEPETFSNLFKTSIKGTDQSGQGKGHPGRDEARIVVDKEDQAGQEGDPCERGHTFQVNGMRTICWKLPLRGTYGEALLHILVMCNDKVHTTIAKLLVNKYPGLVHDIFENDEYYGTSALHLSIAYKNDDMTQLLLSLGASVSQRATGNFFMPVDQQCGMLNRRPTNYAASVDDKVVYNLLISHGADPNVQDSLGNTLLHVVVVKERLVFYSYALKHPVRAARDDIENNGGHTPLALACLLGRDKIFAEIVEDRSIEFWTYSIIICCGYKLNLVDSLELINTKEGLSVQTDPMSALTLISEGKSGSHIDMLKGGIIQKILEEKWKTFGYRKRATFVIFSIANLLIGTSFILRLVDHTELEDAVIIVALPMSWFYLMFFAGGFKLTGPFVSMIRYMLVQDMRQFSIIYLVFLYGFSQAFHFLLKQPFRKVSSSNHKSYEKSWMELFRMTLGAHEYDELRSSYYHWMTQFFFVLFLILVPILLLNMLIAMMGNTYSELISQSEREWSIQWANILIGIERSLPKKEATSCIEKYTMNLNKDPKSKPSSALMVKLDHNT
ncbi:Transient receptor potential cation channel subfamily V member 5 [Halotydeus destructor]|nr:Transient receptor potential cation channel subfamily V member 5 [Halotydeus destructor]